MTDKKAVIMLSGGQDSITALAWACTMFGHIVAVTFRYGQRHTKEIEAARAAAKSFGVARHSIIDENALKGIVHSSLLQSGDLNQPHRTHPQLPSSFVPNRNALFITLAHALCQTHSAKHLVGGMCQVDYSGYPDCRAEFLSILMEGLNIGSAYEVTFHAPLLNKTKAEIFEMADNFKCLSFILEYSHTCYNNSDKENEWGKGCGNCPACKLRKKGWEGYLLTKGIINA